MTTQYSPILKLALPVQGELSGTWGDVVNDNITSMVEQAIAGRAVIDTWTTNSHTLTSANGTTSESRCAMLELTDTGTALSGAGTVVCPTASKIYIVKNAAGQNITVKTSGGTGILVPDGRTTFLFCDGTNVVEALTHTTSLQLGTSTTVTAVLDEDNMASDSDTSLATQQSIKAYVDAQVGANNELSEVLANGNTSGANDIIVDNGQKITVNTIDETTAGSGVTIDSVLLKDDGVNATNLEVTNIKANDGTAAGSIADSTGVVTVASAVLTTADINGGTADGVVIGGSTPAAATVTTATANTSLNIAGTVTVTSILDEDNMASDDPAGLATQQSIKAYVDSQVGTVDTWSEVLANGNTSGATDAVITAGQKITTDTIDETTADAGVTVDGVLLKDSQVSTDQINELTSAAGVTIDSVLLKDDVVNATDIETSTISANDGTTAINIADSTGAVDISSGSLEISGATAQLTLSGATPTVEIGAAGSTNTNLNLRKSSSGTVGINFQRGTTPDTDFRIFMDSSENVNFDWDYSSSIGANRAITFTAEAGANNLLKIDTTGDITFYDGANSSFVYDADSGTTINNNQDARDFTVKSDNNAAMLYVDGTNDLVGVGTDSPSHPSGSGITVYDASIPRIAFKNSTTGNTSTDGSEIFVSGSTMFIQNREDNAISFTTNATTRFTLGNSSGLATLNPGNYDYDFLVKSVNNDNMFFVDAAEDAVKVNTTADSGHEFQVGGSISFQPGGAAFQTTNARPTLKREADGELRVAAGSDSSSQITFYTSPSSGGTLTERVTIEKTGELNLADNSAFDTESVATSATTQTTIHSFNATTYTGAKFLVCVTDSTDTERYITELLVTHDGTTAVATEYGQVATDTALATFDVDISSGAVRLRATPASSNSMTFKVMSTQLLA